MYLARLSLTICKCKYMVHYVQSLRCSNSTKCYLPSITRTRQIDVTSNTLRTNSDRPP
ncbi:hypothetical protein COCCADRAFT_93444 [Bipolaris zeicola 26-R-13]|uniref:Uncharacterized protein n=1 Tax=Cochliobolus carbonum (strain 26-R-13) TaxID=930089 RepID=W6YA83_COCC2|nr:uncharacterized protein COCCADRAFT_93444 [Bipolaris zeicola 26-R-13]EUC34455.1 hypothetical protein COCCADRAFT_93444 [Bipolaris zeicola 26-R-13]